MGGLLPAWEDSGREAAMNQCNRLGPAAASDSPMSPSTHMRRPPTNHPGADV